MKNIYLIMMAGMLCSSCFMNESTSNNRHSEKEDLITAEKKKVQQIKVADLPVHIDSTQYLIHPVGVYEIEEKRSKTRMGSYSGYGAQNFKVSTQVGDEISGNMNSITFQHIETGVAHELTNKDVRIISATFLRDIFNTTKKQLLVYQVIDADTNKDGVKNYLDQKSLYIGAMGGGGFTKLTQQGHELIDWKVIAATNKLFFRSVKDINKNGVLEKEDVVSHHVIDLEKETLTPVYYQL